MWLIILIILAVMFGYKVNEYNYDDAAFIAIIMFFITFFKLFAKTKALENKQLILENKVDDLEKQMNQKLVPSTQEESIATESKQTSTEIEQEQEKVESKQLSVDKIQTSVQKEPEHKVKQNNEDPYFTKAKTKKTTSSSDINSLKQNEEADSLHASNSSDDLINKLKTYFTTGNPLVKVGGVILFFGLSFLIKFAVGNDMISIEFGLLSVIVFSLILIGVGFKYRSREGSFGLILQGIGIAVFYLAIFSAAKFFSVIPFSAALGIMVLAVVFATFLAIIQDAFYLAIFATAGGFLAPILTSTGDGSHIVLFSYYAFLNLSIVAIAWYKSWRLLNLIGFGFTFVIGTLWGVTKYQSEYFATTEPFLILFFLLYVAVAVLFAHRTTFKLKAYVDSALVFGAPSIAFSLQASLGEGIEYFLAYSALGVGALYISLAWWLRDKPKFSLLAESFLALGVIFLSLVFAFAFSPEICSVIYALESSAIIWISLRQNRVYARAFAILLEIYAVGTFLNEINNIHVTKLFLNEVYLGLIILSVATLISAFVYEKYKDKIKSYEASFHTVLLALGLLLWVGAGFYELRYEFKAYLSIYISLSALPFMFIAKRYDWKSMKNAFELFIPASLLLILPSLEYIPHVFSRVYEVAIPIFMVVSYIFLLKIESKFSKYWHAICLWTIVLLLSLEIFYHVEKLSFLIALSAFPLLSMAVIYTIIKRVNFWPLSQYGESYRGVGIQGLAVMLVLWELVAFAHTGVSLVIPYIPLLNPLELAQVSVVATLLLWLKSENFDRSLLLKLIAGAGIVFISFFWARIVHYYADVQYSVLHLQESGLFQTGISIIYTLIALGVIIYSKRNQARSTWIVGASLLGFVIFKLLVADMAQRDSIERIISFLVVGVLILVVGFIAPLPPKKEETE